MFGHLYVHYDILHPHVDNVSYVWRNVTYVKTYDLLKNKLRKVYIFI